MTEILLQRKSADQRYLVRSRNLHKKIRRETTRETLCNSFQMDYLR